MLGSDTKAVLERVLRVQVLSAKLQVLLLEDVIVSNGLKSIPAQTHIQPGVQQEHIFDAGKPIAASPSPCTSAQLRDATYRLKTSDGAHTLPRHAWHFKARYWATGALFLSAHKTDEGAHAEFVFKVDDDFGNFIQMFTVAIEIARNFTIQYGRCATQSPHS